MFNAKHIVKEVEYNKYITIAITRENDRITHTVIIEGKNIVIINFLKSILV